MWGAAPIVRALEGLPRAKRRASGGGRACCPAHEDDEPSLDWRLGDDGRVLLLCRAGCRTEDVVAALGHELADLFAGEDDETPISREGQATVNTDYEIRDGAGALAALHRRRDARDGSKSFLWIDPAGRPGLGGIASSSLPLYGAELVATYDPARPILVTEGEKAADAVRASGAQAVATVCGAGAIPDATPLAVLAQWDVILAPDHDQAGLAHMAALAARLEGLAATVRWLDPAGWPEKADLADVLAPGRGARELHDLVVASSLLAVAPAVWADLRARLGPPPPKGDGGAMGDMGDGREHDGGTSGPGVRVPRGPDLDDEDWIAAYGNGIELPADVRPEAFHGPIGAFAAAVGGVHTIASPLALLATGLAAFGALCGRGSWRTWNEAATYPGLFLLVVGATGEGKGLSLRVTRRWLEALERYDPAMVVSDFTSGEGLIQKLLELEPDAIVGDTRALAWSEEFAAVLRAKGRDGSTLGQILRRAYDGDLLERNTVKVSGRVERPALSMVCHVTPEELRAEATTLDAASGFLNRFLLLPLRAAEVQRPAAASEELYTRLAQRLSEALAMARSHRAPVLTEPAARDLLERLDAWRQISRRRPGLIGRMLERVAQNVGRLSLAYALSRLEPGVLTPEVGSADVTAALALGELAERTVLALWGGTAPDAESARVLARVRAAGDAGISPRDLLKALYSNTNRWRGREVLARMLESGLLRKVPSGRGWRLLAGAQVGEATLWESIFTSEGSPNVHGAVPHVPHGEPAVPHGVPHVPHPDGGVGSAMGAAPR